MDKFKELMRYRKQFMIRTKTTSLIGWIGGLLLSLCAIPQALQSYNQGHSNGLSGVFLAMWAVGELLTLLYVLRKHGFDPPLIVNYIMNLGFLSIIIWYWL